MPQVGIKPLLEEVRCDLGVIVLGPAGDSRRGCRFCAFGALLLRQHALALAGSWGVACAQHETGLM